ncbi:MAG: hypothetical protein U0V70_03285 [Terriglobia bacterium]
MKHKERLLTAINHEEPDRVPLCAWYTPEAEKRLLRHLGVDSTETETYKSAGGPLPILMDHDFLISTVPVRGIMPTPPGCTRMSGGLAGNGSSMCPAERSLKLPNTLWPTSTTRRNSRCPIFPMRIAMTACASSLRKSKKREDGEKRYKYGAGVGAEERQTWAAGLGTLELACAFWWGMKRFWPTRLEQRFRSRLSGQIDGLDSHGREKIRRTRRGHHLDRR